MLQPIATENALISGSRVAYGIYGKGKPVVLLHGTPSSSLIWRNIVPKLVDAGYKVHLFDLLGFGLSERPWNLAVDTSMTGQVSILEGFLELWGLEKTHIVAHDIGGGIAQRFSIFSPERVLFLTLIDVVSFGSYPSKQTKKQMQRALKLLSRRTKTSTEPISGSDYCPRSKTGSSSRSRVLTPTSTTSLVQLDNLVYSSIRFDTMIRSIQWR
ncbi:hypothetical protein SNK04_002872 [Fusarium graminearum]